jgi:hypothetical protein
MDGFLGLLVTSAVTAIVGTALKGIVRPISWALLAGSLLLFGSNKVVEATNSVVASSPSSSETRVADTNNLDTNNLTGVPAAALGWQSATSGLNPAFSSFYAQQLPNPAPNNPAPRPSTTGNSGTAGNSGTTGQTSTPPSNRTPAASAPPPATSRPIQALW